MGFAEDPIRDVGPSMTTEDRSASLRGGILDRLAHPSTYAIRVLSGKSNDRRILVLRT